MVLLKLAADVFVLFFVLFVVCGDDVGDVGRG
jgi:hypothetical protein